MHTHGLFAPKATCMFQRLQDLIMVRAMEVDTLFILRQFR
jgi:hypothetical protein